jgi:hypothetical protein
MSTLDARAGKICRNRVHPWRNKQNNPAMKPFHKKKAKAWLVWEMTALAIGVLLYFFAFWFL